jgi:hypothetical protein
VYGAVDLHSDPAAIAQLPLCVQVSAPAVGLDANALPHRQRQTVLAAQAKEVDLAQRLSPLCYVVESREKVGPVPSPGRRDDGLAQYSRSNQALLYGRGEQAAPRTWFCETARGDHQRRRKGVQAAQRMALHAIPVARPMQHQTRQGRATGAGRCQHMDFVPLPTDHAELVDRRERSEQRARPAVD